VQLHAWLDTRPGARDHRAVVSIDDDLLPVGLKTLHGSRRGVLGPESLRAGRSLRTWLRRLQPDLPLVAFVSGDGLLVADSPRPGVRSPDLAALAVDSATLAPEDRAAALAMVSSLKGGGALLAAGPRPVLLVMQSDLPPGAEAWVAGGPFEPGPFPAAPAAEAFVHERLPGLTLALPSTPEAAEARLAPRGWQGLRVFAGGNGALLQMAAQLARRDGLTVEIREGALDGEPGTVAARLAELAAADGPDLIVAGGHPQGHDPSPLAALTLHWGRHWTRPAPPLLAAAACGRDGNGPGGGAWWLPGPWDPVAADAALADDQAARFFRRQGWLLPRGPAHAAVGAMALILRRPDKLPHPDQAGPPPFERTSP
jgi:glycerate-2-kinase